MKSVYRDLHVYKYFVLFCFSNLPVVFVTRIINFCCFSGTDKACTQRIYSDVVFDVFVCHKNNIF